MLRILCAVIIFIFKPRFLLRIGEFVGMNPNVCTARVPVLSGNIHFLNSPFIGKPLCAPKSQPFTGIVWGQGVRRSSGNRKSKYRFTMNNSRMALYGKWFDRARFRPFWQSCLPSLNKSRVEFRETNLRETNLHTCFKKKKNNLTFIELGDLKKKNRFNDFKQLTIFRGELRQLGLRVSKNVRDWFFCCDTTKLRHPKTLTYISTATDCLINKNYTPVTSQLAEVT